VILLDTDHWTVLKYTDSERYARLHGRLFAAAPELIGTTIVNVEEQLRGWLAAIAKERTLLRQITAYRELTDLFDFFAKLNIISLSADAVDLFNGFRKSGHGSRGGHSSGWLGSTPAGSLCRLSLRESTPFRGAKGDFTLTPAHVTRETRNLNHAPILTLYSPYSRKTGMFYGCRVASRKKREPHE
jgi:hypothetical protein